MRRPLVAEVLLDEQLEVRRHGAVDDKVAARVDEDEDGGDGLEDLVSEGRGVHPHGSHATAQVGSAAGAENVQRCCVT